MKVEDENTVRFDIRWRNKEEVTKKGITVYTENFLTAISEKRDSSIYSYPYPHVIKLGPNDGNSITINIEDDSALYKNLEHGIEVIALLKQYPEYISEILIHPTRLSDNAERLYQEVYAPDDQRIYIEIKEPSVPGCRR